jgi:hypothetical protein
VLALAGLRRGTKADELGCSGGWRCIRFGAVGDPAQEPEGPFAVLFRAEQRGAEDDQADGQSGKEYCRAESWVK